MEEERFVYKSTNHAVNLNNMRLNNTFCDVTIRVDQQEYQAHKVVLAANLKYFQAMLSNGSFKESKLDVINMEGMKGSDFEAFVSYAYTGEIVLKESNALDLLEVANYLGEEGIRDACAEFLKKHLKKEQACRVYKFSSAINCVILKDAAKRTILTNFQDCSQTADFLDFDYEHIKGILFDEETKLEQSQLMFFEKIMRWIKHAIKERRKHLIDLIRFIDTANLTADDLVDCLYDQNIVDCNDEHGMIKDIIYWYHSNKKLITKRQTLAIIGISSVALTFQRYSFTEKKWTTFGGIPKFLNDIYSVAVSLNDELYYVGEKSNKVYLNVFNATTKRNSSLPSSSSILRYSALCSCSRFLYLCGGMINVTSRSDQVLKYNPQTNTFEKLSSMKTNRSSAAAIFFQGYLYVLGGWDGSNDVNSVEKYNPDKNEWVTLPSMSEARACHAVAVLGGKLYVCGGDSVSKSVEVYDPSKNSWQLVASMNRWRYHFTVLAHEDKLFAYGGDDNRTIEVYDPCKDEWQVDEKLSSKLQITHPGGGFIAST